MTTGPHPHLSIRAALFGPHSYVGSALGLVFVWFSLGPSLLPRAPMMQGVVSAADTTRLEDHIETLTLAGQ
jgi:uncharacterized membrane protein